LRQLDVARRLSERGIVGSMCSRNAHDPALPDFGFRPSTQAVIETVGGYLGEAGCMPREIRSLSDCPLYEVAPEPCRCDTDGRKEPELDVMPAVRRYMACGNGMSECDSLCACELEQAGEECLNDPRSDEPGWCYIDAAEGIGDPRFVASCPPLSPRRIRFVGEDYPRADAAVFISCLEVILPEEMLDAAPQPRGEGGP
jgi:hypothetical protein